MADRTHLLDFETGRDPPQPDRQDQRQVRGSRPAHHRAKRVRLSREQAEGFYAVHKERPFFKDLVSS